MFETFDDEDCKHCNDWTDEDDWGNNKREDEDSLANIQLLLFFIVEGDFVIEYQTVDKYEDDYENFNDTEEVVDEMS